MDISTDVPIERYGLIGECGPIIPERCDTEIGITRRPETLDR